MVYTAVETIALIMIVVAAIKMIVLLINPVGYLNFAKGLYKKPILAQVVGFILAAVVLYYLINSGLTIVQILAVAGFVSLFLMVGLASSIGPLMKKFDAQIKQGNMWKEYWFYTLIWIVLLVWAAKEIFM